MRSDGGTWLNIVKTSTVLIDRAARCEQNHPSLKVIGAELIDHD
jgi:hypothetical protein